MLLPSHGHLDSGGANSIESDPTIPAPEYEPAMNPPVTMHTGPLGSTIHALRADAGTVAELAAIDWTRHYRRVCLDPAAGSLP